ncbi:DUF1456 family protein, partial [Pseudomonas syringae group genomosp. 7]|uniref:DUF1456 family protein n=1 Tax=Pseudomonas syringae group genomosp. 7 TaxID=251699 RepID=UPI00376F9FC9
VCRDEIMAHYLDGQVYFNRGSDECSPPQPIDLPNTNNIFLKKLSVAFEMKEDDMHPILKSVDFHLSKPPLRELLRKVGQTNYSA